MLAKIALEQVFLKILWSSHQLSCHHASKSSIIDIIIIDSERTFHWTSKKIMTFIHAEHQNQLSRNFCLCMYLIKSSSWSLMRYLLYNAWNTENYIQVLSNIVQLCQRSISEHNHIVVPVRVHKTVSSSSQFFYASTNFLLDVLRS